MSENKEIETTETSVIKKETAVIPKPKDLSVGELFIYYGTHPKLNLLVLEKTISTGAFSNEEKQLAQRALVYSLAKDSIPKRYIDNPMAIFTVMLHGKQIGLCDMQAMTNITLINGVPCLWGPARMALIMASNKCTGYKVTYFDSKFKEISLENANLDDEVYGCQVQMERADKSLSATFTKKDAENGGLFNKEGFAWKRWTRDMLKHRAAHRVEDALFADVLNGIGSAEAMTDAMIVESKQVGKIDLDKVGDFE